MYFLIHTLILKETNQIFIHKNIEHHIERHFETKNKQSDFLQYINCGDEFFKKRLFLLVDVQETEAFSNLVMDEYGLDEITDDYEYLSNSLFTNFFKYNGVDIPKCFKKTKSMLNSKNELPVLKFLHFLMRDGQKLKSSVILQKSINLYLKSHKQAYFKNLGGNFNNWRSVYLSLNFLNYTDKKYAHIQPFQNDVLNYNNRLDKNAKFIGSEWNIISVIFRNLPKLEPMFSFYIYRVDKKIFKNTRGKSGKFTFIWKYIAPYKRNFLVFSWLIRELRLKSGKNLILRLYDLISTLSLDYKRTWIYRVRKFSHNYVYKNCRRTLAESYITSTK